MDTPILRQIGEFILHERIGRGGAASIYSAFQVSVNRYVALKIIDLRAGATSEENDVYEQRFAQEARVLALLEHPHIVPIYHYGIVPNEYAYIAMRLMHGSLSNQLNGTPLPPETVIDIALQLTSGLDYAHSKGIIHRDIKPGNVLFDEAGSACLADFGLAKSSEYSLAMNQPGSLVGTALYASPEQIRGSQTDNRSDIYSLGVVLYEMLTGRLPYDTQNQNLLSLLYKIEYEEPIALRKLNPDVPPELERIVMQAMRKEPRERFFDVHEMANALENIPGLAVRQHSRPSYHAALKPPISRLQRYRRLMLLAIGVLLLIALALVVIIRSAPDHGGARILPTVVANQHGSPDDVVPSPVEVARAQSLLGARGFIAYVACALDSQSQAARARELRDLASSNDIPLRIYNSELDAYKQLTLIEEARIDGARAFILCPLRSEVLSESLQSLDEAKIPVVLTDVLPENYNSVMLDRDNRQIGVNVGRELGAQLAQAGHDQANVVILDYPDYATSDARVDGFLDGLLKQLPGAQIVARLPVSATRSTSQTAVADLLAQGETFDAVFSVTDTGAYGTIAALEAAGIAPDSVIVASVGGESVALDYVYNGYFLRITVDSERETGSYAAYNAAVKLLGGGIVPEIVNLPAGIVITRDILVGTAPDNSTPVGADSSVS